MQPRQFHEIPFYIQWDKEERVAAVRDFCSWAVKDLMKLIEFAKIREFMQIKDRREVISDIW
jgi:hypothetical protein